MADAILILGVAVKRSDSVVCGRPFGQVESTTRHAALRGVARLVGDVRRSGKRECRVISAKQAFGIFIWPAGRRPEQPLVPH